MIEQAAFKERLTQRSGLLVGSDSRGVWVTTDRHLKEASEVGYVTLSRKRRLRIRFVRRYAGWVEHLVYGAQAALGYGAIAFACLVSLPLLAFAAAGALPWSAALCVSAICWLVAWLDLSFGRRANAFVGAGVRESRELILREVAKALEDNP